jgi:two-component system, chemotaxis family, chemotaxis protein CheY
MKLDTLMGGPVLLEALEDQMPVINYRRLETVLVIEDHPDLGRALTMQLEAAGLNVALAKDGIEGLEKIWLLEPELIVLDIHLPRLHGFRLLERLRRQPNLKDCPILAVTGDPDPAIEARAEQWGIRGFFRKPVPRRVFVKAVLDILAGA